MMTGSPLYAATITVNTTDDELNADGDCSLREAVRASMLNSAVDGCAQGTGTADTIMLPAGTFRLTVVGDESEATGGDLNILTPTTIQGVGATSTIIDGNDVERVFESQSTLTLRNLTVQHGDPTSHGNSFDSLGGGIRQVSGALTLDHCIVKDNVALSGGGLYVSAATALTIIDSEISGNTTSGAGTSNGGGISIDGTPTTITNTTIAGNSALQTNSQGGGLFIASNLNDVVTTIIASTISGNSAKTGAGISNQTHSELRLRNVTISGNTSAGIGNGLLQSFGNAVTIQNSTIVNNIGPGTGVQHDSGAAITLQNTIVADNGAVGDPADCGGNVVSAGYNLIETPGGCVFAQPGDQTGVDPALGTLALHGGTTKTHEPAAQSPAINRGNPSTPGSGNGACESTDQNGTSRPIAGLCDVGAMETTNQGPATTSTTSTTASSTTSTTGTTTSTVTTSSTAVASTSTSTSTVPPTTTTTLPSSCATLSGAIVRVKRYAAPAGNEALVVNATIPLAGGVPATLDPTTTGLQVRIFDLGAAAPLLDFTGGAPVPAGARGSVACGKKDGWKKLAYLNKSGAVDPPACTSGSATGLRSITLTDKRKKNKGIAFALSAPSAALNPPVGPLSIEIVLGGEAALAEGACGTVTFGAGQCAAKGKTWTCK